MEKIIIVGPKNFIQRMVIMNMISSVIKDVLILDPKENPDYEDIIKDAGDSLVCVLDDSETKQIKKEIGEFDKVLELKSRETLDVKVKPLMDETPWYDRFLKKGKKIIVDQLIYNQRGNEIGKLLFDFIENNGSI